MMHRVRHTLLANALLGALTLIPHAPVFAGQPVDTSTLNPVPPADYTCQADGANVICRVTRSFFIPSVSTSDYWDAPFQCGGQLIYESYQRTQDLTRYYAYEGTGYYLTRRLIHETGLQTLSLAPTIVTPTVAWTTHLTSHTVLATPGDLSTATTTNDGLDGMATSPGLGLLFHLSGQSVWDSNDNLVSFNGPRDLDTEFESSLARLCTALGAP